MKIVSLLFALVVSVVASDALATAHESHKPQSTSKSASSGAQGDPFARLDTNKDGWLSRTELASHPMAGHAGMVDADKDGRLSRAEFQELQSM